VDNRPPSPEWTSWIIMVIGPWMAFLLSALRALYDDHEKRAVRIALEAGICAGITVTGMSIVLALVEYYTISLNHQTMVYLSAGMGSFVGWIGANEIRGLVLREFKRRESNDKKT